MKLLRVESLIETGSFPLSLQYKEILFDIQTAIRQVVWPPESESFTIYPERRGNGVRPIKQNCMAYLLSKGWRMETRLNIATRIKPGPIDAVTTIEGYGDFALEWETGNVSSSHRSLDKMAIGLLEKSLIGGILVVPSRSFYRFLTDRIGNFSEIEPYFTLYKGLNVPEGVLAVIEIEHDRESTSVPHIPKGTDGRARR